MNGISIDVTLTPTDWHAYQAAFVERVKLFRSGPARRVGATTVIFLASLVGAVAIAAVMSALGERLSTIPFVLGAALAVAALSLAQKLFQRHAQPDADGWVLGTSHITFDLDGIRVRKPDALAQYAWSLVQDSTLTTEHLFLWIDRVAALIIPLRDLPDGTDGARFIEELKSLSAESQRAERDDSAELPALVGSPPRDVEVTRVSPRAGLLRATARLWTLRTADASALNIGDGTAATIVVACLATLVGVDWTLAEPGSMFSPYGLLACAWYAITALTVAWSASRLSQPRVDYRQLVLAAIVFLPAAVLLRICFDLWVPDRLWTTLGIITALYATFVLDRVLRSLTARRQHRAVLVTLVLTCAVAAASEQLYLSTTFWYPDYENMAEGDGEETSYREHRDAAEATLFGQSERIRDDIAALDRPHDLPAAGFFVGFAGMGEQRVFAGEVSLARQVIGDKFGTAKRSISLVNDRRDLESHPLASPTALRHTLAALSRRMDLDKDVLFLSLSSHGSDDATLSVSNLSMPLNDLSAQEVASALRDAGIKWRVVIVSACYAGTFIEPLRDDHTIVITASAADRTSFGCSDERELTYFGEAFYRDALPSAPDLRTAFERTQAAIAEREKLERKKESRPQAHFGAAISAHLANIH